MRIKSFIPLWRGWRNQSTLVENKGVKISKFNKNARKNHTLDCYFELEDDYRRLSRNCKIPYYIFGILTAMPTSISMFTPPSSSYTNVLVDQLKMSSMTLSWMAATHIGFQLTDFGRCGLLSQSRGIVGIFFAVVGVAGTLIGTDYYLIRGFYSTIVCYALMGWYNAILASKRLFPKSLLKPSNNIVLLNLVLASLSLKKAHSIKHSLEHTSHEDIVRTFESQNKS